MTDRDYLRLAHEKLDELHHLAVSSQLWGSITITVRYENGRPVLVQEVHEGKTKLAEDKQREVA